MKILMIYPKYPDTFWSFKHALKFISKIASVPPLGLLTISAMLPPKWEKKLVDLNVSKLEANDLLWADYVFISAMYIQKESVEKIIYECKKLNKKIIAGGPLFTQEHKNYKQVDHLVLNEAEITLPQFLSDLEHGKTPNKIYRTHKYANLVFSPVPDFHLLKLGKYASMNIQVSRGCPYSCEFCEITTLLGHKVRMKQSKQVLDELDSLYKLNWRGPVAIVDDNFTANKKVIKNDLLPAMKLWMQEHNYPFTFNIQSTITIADDKELLKQLTEAGFNSTFIGIETPVEDSLHECNKIQNTNRDLIQSVKEIQKAGMQVSGGFIVGFDNDSSDIFQRLVDFIQQTGIVSAMVGLLNAPKNTRLYKRMKAENRLTVEPTGDNTDFTMNFTPRMSIELLLEGYKSIIMNIYNPKPFYERVRNLLINYRKKHVRQKKFQLNLLIAFLKSILIIGILNKGQIEYWKNLIWTLFHRPTLFVEAVTLSVYGYHYRRVFNLRNNYSIQKKQDKN